MMSENFNNAPSVVVVVVVVTGAAASSLSHSLFFYYYANLVKNCYLADFPATREEQKKCVALFLCHNLVCKPVDSIDLSRAANRLSV